MDPEFIVFGQPMLDDAEIQEVIATLDSRWLGTGPRVARFEQAFANYRRVPTGHAAAVNSGTAALHLSLLASGVSVGDEVIVPAMTFCASVNAIINSGATPVLADVDRETMNLDPSDIESRITERTRAILPVHFAGRPCNMTKIMQIAERHGLKVIEDCAHAIETEWDGKPVGTFGDFGCFSFYVTKNLTTGEGGMVIAKNQDDINQIKVLALHGMSKDAWHRFSDSGYKHYDVVASGFKYNMMDLQAAIGIHQLEKISKHHKMREELWDYYNVQFGDLPIVSPSDDRKNIKHGFHLYTVLVDEKSCGVTRDDFLGSMTASKIGVGVHYRSIAQHSFYQERFGFRPGDYPQSEYIGNNTVSLPLSAAVSHEQRSRIVSAVRSVLTN